MRMQLGLRRQDQIVGAGPTQREQASSRRDRLEPPMHSDTDGIVHKCLPDKRERPESNGSRFHVLEAAVANHAIELTRIMAFWLKP